MTGGDLTLNTFRFWAMIDGDLTLNTFRFWAMIDGDLTLNTFRFRAMNTKGFYKNILLWVVERVSFKIISSFCASLKACSSLFAFLRNST